MGQDQKILTVLFGAGASHDCHPYKKNGEYFPQFPLTQNLFQFDGNFDLINGAKNYLLRKFPGAAAIGRLYTNDSAKGLEEFLRLQLATEDPNKACEVYQTKFFIREYLGLLSEYVQTELTRSYYVNLINYFAGLNYDQILLITTNYDLLLDYRLHDHLRWNFRGWEDYLGPNEKGHQGKWFYVKLHGSVNWRKRVLKQDLDKAIRDNKCLNFDELVLHDPKSILDAKGTKEVINLIPSVGFCRPEQARDTGLWVNNRFRYDEGGGNDFVSAPILLLPHDDKEPICDPAHINKAKKLIKNTQELWIIGNSLEDQHLQELLGLITTVGLKISIVDPGDKAKWLDRMRNIFQATGNHLHHAYTIFYRNYGGHLSNFISGGLSFPKNFTQLYEL